MVSIVKGVEKNDSLWLKIRDKEKLYFHDIPFLNYFYVIEDDLSEIPEHVLKRYFSTCSKCLAANGTFYKLFLKNNYYRNFARKALEENDIKVYEADIPSFKRYIIDNQNVDLNHNELKKIWLDIETVDVGKLQKDFNGKIEAVSPVLSCAIKDFQTNEIYFFDNKAIKFINKDKLNKLKKEYLDNNKKIPKEEYGEFVDLLYKNEKRLLEEIINFMKNYDLVLAWNGKGFDFPYLKQRMQEHALSYEDIIINDMDYMEIYKINSSFSNISVENYKLETVSYEELKSELDNKNTRFKNIHEIKKVDWKEITKAQKYIDLYLFYPDVFKEYNIQDVNLMHLIEQKLNFLDLNVEQSKISRCPIQNTVFDSYNSDFLLLNEYKKLNYIVESKPNKEIIESRKNPKTGLYPPGGYTYVREKGLHFSLFGFDYKSQYPTMMITYNISPETYIKEINPLELKELESIFSKEELEYLKFALKENKKHLDAKGSLKSSYDKVVDKKRMEKLMWKFTNEYKMLEVSKLAVQENFTFTPADLNYDTRGWALHPHYCFTKKFEGVASKIERVLLTERDKVKYELKNITDEYEKRSKNNYQLGLKVSANSLYGGFGFKSFRFFKYEIPTAITTAARYLTKKSILFAKSLGFETSHGDTDSAFIKEKNNKITIDELEDKFFNYYNDYIKPFNTLCEIKLFNPNKKQQEICNHFIVFEKEKFYESCIVVAKKRYYYKEIEDGKPKYGTQGGAFKRKDILDIAKEYQKELVKDILDKNFDKLLWKNKILKLREKVFNFGLDDSQVIKSLTLTRSVDDFGKPVIDGKTGLQKKRKSDGELMFAPIPAHIKVAKKLLDDGEELEIDDKIKYVVIESKPKIQAISLKEYTKNKRYDAKYYWRGIESVLKEILEVVDKNMCYVYFREDLNDKKDGLGCST